jgi:hypothetical protein
MIYLTHLYLIAYNVYVKIKKVYFYVFNNVCLPCKGAAEAQSEFHISELYRIDNGRLLGLV